MSRQDMSKFSLIRWFMQRAALHHPSTITAYHSLGMAGIVLSAVVLRSARAYRWIWCQCWRHRIFFSFLEPDWSYEWYDGIAELTSSAAHVCMIVYFTEVSQPLNALDKIGFSWGSCVFFLGSADSRSEARKPNPRLNFRSKIDMLLE